MTLHLDDSELQDLREGLLSPEDDERVREHLAGCSECRAELEALSRLLEDLGDLPLEAAPARDLWPQIAWRIEGGEAVPKDTEGLRNPLQGTRQGTDPGEIPERQKSARRISLPAWQLLAASITIALISGGSVWAVLSDRTAPADGDPFPGSFTAQMAGWGEAYGGYDEAITDLEAVLEAGQGVLDPQTLRVLEQNLETIDTAIREVGEALTDDPGSAVLQRILAHNLRRKMDLLRKAAVVVYANT
jgi:hypothetical protein